MGTLVLSPHLDDAALSAWCPLAAGDAEVVNVCTGCPAPGTLGVWDERMGARDSAEWMAERVAEDRRALAHAGVEPANLPFLDEQYRDGEPLDLEELRARLGPLIAGASGVFAPAGIGGHADHLAVRDVALIEGADRGVPVFLYADQPYATRFGWPGWVAGREPDGERAAESDWARFMSAIPAELEADVVRLSAEELAGKVAALRDYGTQLAGLETVSAVTEPEISGVEVRWKATGPRR